MVVEILLAIIIVLLAVIVVLLGLIAFSFLLLNWQLREPKKRLAKNE